MDSVERRLAYLSLAHLSDRWSQHHEPDPLALHRLAQAELRVFSQNGEDGVIEALFRCIGTAGGRFVEFGIEAGVEGNCVFLAEVLGWSGVFMEADAEKWAVAARRYRDRPEVRVLCTTVTPDNINSLILDAGFGDEIDVLSIDIDSHDYWVWAAITAVSPRLVVIEYNSHIPYPDARVQPLADKLPWQGTDYFGASLGALEQLGKRLGYHLVYTDLAGVNAFFVRSDLVTAESLPETPVKRAPNFFLTGLGHPADQLGRTMVDPGPA